MAKNSKFREELSANFVKALKEDPKEWKKGWSCGGTGRAYNYSSGRKYNGKNLLNLKFIEKEAGYEDPRWMTFKQIQTAGYHLRKGSKGARIEFSTIRNNETGKNIGWAAYIRLAPEEQRQIIEVNGKETKKYSQITNVNTVFNCSCIDGIDKFVAPEKREITPSEVVSRVAEGMGVTINEAGGDRAYYSPSLDNIILPKREQFLSDYEYNTTALHELGHATGHPDRLNRDQTGSFGSESYAKEELIAEITSAFMGEYLDATDAQGMENHEAYVKGWVEEIENNSDYLFTAITAASKAADYMIDKGGLDKDIQEAIETVAAYEDEQNIPEGDRLTQWYGDLAVYEMAPSATYTDILDKAESIKNMTLSEENEGNYLIKENTLSNLTLNEVRAIQSGEVSETIEEGKILKTFTSADAALAYLNEKYQSKVNQEGDNYKYTEYSIACRDVDAEGDVIGETIEATTPRPLSMDPQRSMELSYEPGWLKVTLSNACESESYKVPFSAEKAFFHCKKEFVKDKESYAAGKVSLEELVTGYMDNYTNMVTQDMAAVYSADNHFYAQDLDTDAINAELKDKLIATKAEILDKESDFCGDSYLQREEKSQIEEADTEVEADGEEL